MKKLKGFKGIIDFVRNLRIIDQVTLPKPKEIKNKKVTNKVNKHK